MPATKLDHYNIWTTKIDETIQFYVDVLGLRVGDRPPVSIPGAWIYDGTDMAVVHLVDVTKCSPEDLVAAGGRDITTLDGSGSIDHVAFEASDFEGLQAKLAATGCEFHEDGIPAFNIRQLFVNDPNGIRIELNFRS